MSFLHRVRRAPMAVSSLGLAVFASTSIPGHAQTLLPPVFVTATRFSDDANTLPFGVRVLSADDIRRSGVDTVNEALMKLLGVPGRQDLYGGGDYTLDLRGFGGTADSNQVIVVDGVKLNEADLGGTRLAGIPIDSVERIEVIRGSGSVLYGEGAAAGVIVITTRAGSGTARANAAQLHAAAGSFGKRELRAGATLAAGDFSLDLATNKRRADNHRDNFKSDLGGATVSGQWHNDWLRLGLGHADDELDTGLPGSLTAAEYASNPRQTLKPDDRASVDNRRNTLFAQATWGDWQLVFDAGWRDKSLTSLSGGFPYDYDVDASTQSLRARHAGRFGDLGNTLVLGFDRGQWERQVLASPSVATQRSHATYLRDELKLAGDTRLSAGWRSETVRKSNSDATTGVDESQAAWELGVLQPVAAGAAVYARFGKSFRLPNVDEFGFTKPKVSLRAQTSRDAELGARWAAGGRRVEARLYRSSLTDEIGYDPSVPNPYGGLGANANYDPTRRQGLEIEASQPLTDTFTLHLNAAARRAQFRSGAHSGKDVPLTPRHTLSLRGEWQPAPGHQVDVLLNQVAAQHPDFDNACRMPSYATLDLRYAYRWQQAEFALGVANLGDRKYYTLAFRCEAGVPTAIYPEAGRAVTASVRLDF